MGDPGEGLRDALADRYTIERELGRGGMATVYLARDLKHDRPVALKVLHADLAAALGGDRFQREIKLAARLQHPHILTVHDSGETVIGRKSQVASHTPATSDPGPSTVLWFTMPFIEGESLRDRLSREKQLPLDAALRIARETADALDYAHRHDVIHRDIKPENILLSEGHALVADFGIGKALTQASDQKLTETGMAVGTPAYMSPEQAAGDKDLDPRSDVYSLAIVLYEMLAGATPFDAPTLQATIARRFTETARPLRQVRDSVPESVELAVQRALARTAADRFATAAEFARALGPADSGAHAATTVTPTAAAAKPSPPSTRRRPLPTALVTMVIGFVVGLGILFAWRRSHGSDGEPSAGAGRRLAVLPFQNLGDSSDEYFADGMTDEIRGKLAKLQGLQVIASGSTGQYKHTDKTPTQIAQELGVQYLLTGKIRWEKGEGGKSRVRVSPELVQVGSGGAPTTKWQEPFDASLTDVFQVQADIAGRVASALDVALGSTERETIAKRPTENLAAYDAFLKGEEISASIGVADPATLRQAIVHYERAVAFDTTFVQAWAQLSRARSRTYTNGSPDPALAAGARAAAERALALAPDRADGRLALGTYYGEVLSDNDKAIEQFDLGRKIDPRNADLLAGIAVAEQGRGHYDLVVRDLTEAQAMDPRSAQTARRLARALLWLRRYPEALAAANRGLELSPSNIDMIENKAMVYIAQGDLARGREVLSRTPPQLDDAVYIAGIATYWDLYWALTDDQQRLLLRLTPEPFDNNRTPWALSLAGAYALRGDAAKARAYADSARTAFEEQLKISPDDSQLHALYGVALAYLGRRDQAVAEGKRSLELLPLDKDAFSAPYNQHQVVRIYILTGQQEKAIDLLEPLLQRPYYLSPGWLKVDPNFDPLRQNPRFQKLSAGGG